jgi:hypothetical protein
LGICAIAAAGIRHSTASQAAVDVFLALMVTSAGQLVCISVPTVRLDEREQAVSASL